MNKQLFDAIQWTWGLTVNLAGGAGYLFFRRKKYRQEPFYRAFITYVPKNFGGLSLGKFIFIKENGEETWTYNTRIHEYGHTWQCLLLGPLYWIVVALPSAVWCNCLAGYRKKHDISYYKLYCEKWANRWGERFTGLKQDLPEKDRV